MFKNTYLVAAITTALKRVDHLDGRAERLCGELDEIAERLPEPGREQLETLLRHARGRLGRSPDEIARDVADAVLRELQVLDIISKRR